MPRTRDEINADMQRIFAEQSVQPDGPGEEAFWNAWEDVLEKDREAADKLSELADEWEKAS